MMSVLNLIIPLKWTNYNIDSTDLCVLTSHWTLQVELYRNDQHRFKIVVDGENEVDLMVQTRHMRDVIVLVIRGFAQRFNSTSLNSLLKIET